MKKSILLLSLIAAFQVSAAEYTCFGTEPFWGLTITDSVVKFDEIEGPKADEKILSKEDAAGTTSDYAFVVKTPKTQIAVVTGECNDGMSDNIYSHHALVTTKTQVLYGCCNLKK